MMNHEDTEPRSRADDLTLPFGQYKGRTLGEVADTDLRYLDWLIGQDWFLAKYRGLAEAVGDICLRRSHELDHILDED